MKSISGHTQPTLIVLYITFLVFISMQKNPRHWLFTSRDIDDQRILLFQSTIWSATWIMCITLLKKYFFIIKNLIKLLFWNLAVPLRLPEATPYKFRQIWVWLDFSQHTHQKAVVLKLTFPWWISPCKKPKKLMHYFHV